MTLFFRISCLSAALMALSACLTPVTQTATLPGSSASGAPATEVSGSDGLFEETLVDTLPGADSPGGVGAGGGGSPPDASPPSVPPSSSPKAPGGFVAENTQSGMPSGQVAASNIVEKGGYVALQGTKENRCRVGELTSVRTSGRVVLFKENEEEPYAFNPGPMRLRVYYKKEEGSRLYAYVETNFLKESNTAFYRADVSVMTGDPSSLRYYVVNTITNEFWGPIPTDLEEIPAPSPLPNCYQATMTTQPSGVHVPLQKDESSEKNSR